MGFDKLFNKLARGILTHIFICFRTIQDPASQRLTWYKPPLTVLVIKKVRDATVIPPFIQMVKWFTEDKRMVVFVEEAIMDDDALTNNPAFTPQIRLLPKNLAKDL